MGLFGWFWGFLFLFVWLAGWFFVGFGWLVCCFVECSFMGRGYVQAVSFDLATVPENSRWPAS